MHGGFSLPANLTKKFEVGLEGEKFLLVDDQLKYLPLPADLTKTIMKRKDNGRFTSLKAKVKVAWYWTKFGGVVAMVALIAYGVGVADKSSVVYAQNTPQQIVSKENEAPVLLRIADCESGGGKVGGAHQFNKDGSIVMHQNTNGSIDEGIMQINLTESHINEAAKLGMDLATEDGNKAFGKWIYENEGTGPWASSAKCWQ